jgi:hypothetical protein
MLGLPSDRTKEAVAEFKEIYKKEFGVELSDEEATSKATGLLNLFDIIYKPISKEMIKKK